MKLTLQTKHKTVSIETGHDELSIDDVIDDLIIPAIVAMGYSKDNIEDYLCELADQLDRSTSDWGFDEKGIELGIGAPIDPNDKVDGYSHLVDFKD